MGRPCTVCTHAQREAINEALAEGNCFREIAAQYCVSKTALHRHWQAHVADAPASTPTAPRQASVTARPPLVTWGVWAAGIVEVLGRAGETEVGKV